MMKASGIHYFFAGKWPIKIWMVVFPLVAGTWAGSSCWTLLVSPANWKAPLVFLGLVLLASLLGYFVGILVGWPVIGLLYYDRSLKNGEPFKRGDTVQILVGQHRDRIVPVIEAFDYAPYAGGHRIRVDLGPDVKDNVFGSSEILRLAVGNSSAQEEQKQPNQASDATSEPAPGTGSSAHQGCRSAGVMPLPER
jgi:hypothetical protein